MNATGLALPVSGERFRLEQGDGAELRVVRLADGEPIGKMTVELEADRQLFVRALCIDSPHRGYGAGSEAVRLFNQLCEGAGAELIRTWAPPDRGLAVYFWIRMGYRPLGGEGPEGGLWFERRAGQPQSSVE